MDNSLADNRLADGNECLAGNSVKIMQPELQIRRPVGLRRHLQKLAGSLGLEKSNKDMLKSMFSSCTSFVPVYDRKFQCEIVFSFWGFVKSDDARFKLLDFLVWLMQPRMYIAAETKEGHHVEAIMIISLERLHIKRDVFESWLDLFFDRLHMSAGTLVFTEYMGEQMISCMDRILRSQKLRTNLFVEWNKDFLLLYRNLLKTREDQERVLAVTDMAFTTENFINISSNNTNGRANGLQPVSLRPGDWNWRILLRTLPPPNEEVELYAEDIPIPNSAIWPIQ
jgi:hypothetical protein